MKKRYKLLIGFLMTGIILVSIFFITRDNKIYYLSLGDSLAAGQTPYKTIDLSYSDYVSEYLKDKNKLKFYTKKFAKSGYRSFDLLNDLKNNKKIKIGKKEITIKHALIKADLVTLSIGSNDLFYKLNIGEEFDLDKYDDIYKYVDESFVDINKLLYELRKSCKEQIMVLGFYNPLSNYSSTYALEIEPIIKYANEKMEDLTSKYDMTFIDLHDTFYANDEYLPNFLEIHPTKEGYKAISDVIISSINEKTLAK